MKTIDVDFAVDLEKAVQVDDCHLLKV